MSDYTLISKNLFSFFSTLPFSVHSYQGDASVRDNHLAQWEQTFSMYNAKFVPEAAFHFMITDVSPNPCQTWHQL